MRRKFRSVMGVLIVATLVALSVRLFLIEDFRVSSGSMFPCLWEGDLIFVSKSEFSLRLPFSTYEVVKFRHPYRGQIVAFTLPDRPLETFVKRVIALAGDRVSMEHGVLSINGVPFSYEPAPVPNGAPPSTVTSFATEGKEGQGYVVEREKLGGKDYGPVDVPADHFFVLGDNRADSVDSRTWGPIPYSCLKGKVALVWLSLDHTGSVRRNRRALWIN